MEQHGWRGTTGIRQGLRRTVRLDRIVRIARNAVRAFGREALPARATGVIRAVIALLVATDADLRVGFRGTSSSIIEETDGECTLNENRAGTACAGLLNYAMPDAHAGVTRGRVDAAARRSAVRLRKAIHSNHTDFVILSHRVVDTVDC